ncbi:cytochrome P450 7A1-like [Babylonia areolata]|uniref:cytochrome P450 7A1-like n=1 Tax=Babylonia areolata TaxID=304850 RepID=UPI003FD44D9B
MVAVSLYLVAAVVALTVAYFKYFFRTRREGEPPYVPGHPLWGNGADFAQHAVRFMHRSQKALGDIFTIRLLNQYVTLVLDPHCFEQFSKERSFDFDLIQKQVNMNVFSFELKKARKMISEAGKKVNGKYLSSGLENFAANLDRAFRGLQDRKRVDLNGNVKGEGGQQCQDGLRTLTANTLFNALFYTIFGRANQDQLRESQVLEMEKTFNPEAFHENFDIFHKFFNYLWLGVPVNLFPKACQALQVLSQQPAAHQMLEREGVSEYIKFSTSYMLEHEQSAQDIVGHNLVFLHVNYNTFRVAFWCLYQLLQNSPAREALLRELQEAVEERRGTEEGQNGQAGFTIEEFDKLPVLDSFLKETIRVSSGVFMVRKVTEDTQFTMPNGQTYTVREGDRVAMYPPAHHMDSEIFHDPETFKYDRFVDATFYKNGKELKNPLIGFGSLCPGKRMSLLQIKWFLLNVLNGVSMELVEGERTELNTKYYGHEILPPVNDVQVRYSLKPQAPHLAFLPRKYSS